MEIKDKQAFKIKLKEKIDKYIRQFPFHFYFNIIINILLCLVIIALALMIIAAMKIDSSSGDSGEFVGYMAVAMVSVIAILRVTFKGFLKNLNTLEHIRHGHYNFGIEDHELDNAVEFLEDLPMKKEDVDRLRVALTFDKLIDVLETVGIITYEKGEYKLDIVLRYEMEYPTD